MREGMLLRTMSAATPQPSPTNLSDELNRILERLENEVAHDIQLRLTQHRSGRSPKSIHREAIAAITAAYAEAIRGAVPQWADEAYYTKHPVVWKPIAPESNAEHYDAGFNQAIDTFTTNLKNQGLL